VRNDARRNVDWQTPEGIGFTWEHIAVEVLMDIRDELQRLNALLHCSNFVGIPSELRKIARNTAKPKPKRRRK
jgi:hypothetical protein